MYELSGASVEDAFVTYSCACASCISLPQDVLKSNLEVLVFTEIVLTVTSNRQYIIIDFRLKNENKKMSVKYCVIKVLKA